MRTITWVAGIENEMRSDAEVGLASANGCRVEKLPPEWRGDDRALAWNISGIMVASLPEMECLGYPQLQFGTSRESKIMEG